MKRLIDFIRLVYYWTLWKLDRSDFYCPKCRGCGYIECCPAKMCKPGFACAGYYTPEELDGSVTCENTDDY